MIGPVIGHLGPRVSALLDGQLSAADEERAWDHVHSCHQCRDAVEREGWVKTRLATMQYAGSTAPSHLKGSLLFQGIATGWADSHDDALLGTGAGEAARSRRHLGLTGIGGGAVGAAVMGVLALGASPANAAGRDRTAEQRAVRHLPDQRHHLDRRPGAGVGRAPRAVRGLRGHPAVPACAGSYTRAVGPRRHPAPSPPAIPGGESGPRERRSSEQQRRHRAADLLR